MTAGGIIKLMDRTTISAVLMAMLAAVGFAPACTVAAGEAPAQVSGSATFPIFDIRRFEVSGNTLLPAERIDELLKPHAGTGRSFSDVQRALETLQQAYVAAGHSAVRVVLPEQEIERGVVRLRVIEGRIRSVTVEGNRFHDVQNILAGFPDLRKDGPPSARGIESGLKLTNENPSKKAQVHLRRGAAEGDIDATVKVADQKTWRAGAILDNTGSPQTGDWRLGVFYQLANFGNRDQVFTFQYTTSPDHIGDVSIFGAGYHVPFYAWGDSADLFAGYADVDSGTVQDVFSVSGKGTVFGARYNLNLARRGNYDHKLVFGLDYRAYRSNVVPLGAATTLVPDVTVHPLSVGYVGHWTDLVQQFSLQASAAANLPGGSDGGDAAFNAVRAGASSSYALARYGADWTRSLPADWQLHLAANGQYTGHALVHGEQFGLGGAGSVRGFREREIAEDSGLRGTVELYTPDFGSRVQSDLRARALLFYDIGRLTRNKPLAGETVHTGIASAGAGLRVSAGQHLGVQADLARVMDSGAQQGAGDWRLHVGITVSY